MLRISLEIVPLTVFSLELWAAVVLVVALAVVARRRNATNRGRLVEFCALIPLPILLLAWGLFFWPSNGSGRGPHEVMALTGAQIFLLAEVALAAWLVWRRPRHVVLTTAVACLALVWTTAAKFVADMAITNTWL